MVTRIDNRARFEISQIPAPSSGPVAEVGAVRGPDGDISLVMQDGSTFKALSGGGVIPLTPAEIAAPSAAVLADKTATYQRTTDNARFVVNAAGTGLAMVVDGATLAASGGAAIVGTVAGFEPFTFTQLQQALTQFNTRLGNTAYATDPAYGAVANNGATNQYPAIQAALNSGKKLVKLPAAGENYYRIDTPLLIPNGVVFDIEGANLTSTVAGIIRWANGGICVLKAARAILQTNTTVVGSAIAIADGATISCQPFIFGFPRILALNAIVSGEFRGVNFSGCYSGYFEVEVSTFYASVYGFGDGTGNGPLTTYYNTFNKPKLNPGPQGYAALVYNLCNGTDFILPKVNGLGSAFGGLYFANSDACNVIGGYIETFANSSSASAIVLENSNSNTVVGVTCDTSNIGDEGTSKAVRIIGTSTENQIHNVSFAGDWNSSTRKILHTSSGSNRVTYGSTTLDWFSGTAGEGAFTPNQGAGLTVAGAFTSSGNYRRDGNKVTVKGWLNAATSISASSAGVLCSNLPFSQASNEGGGTRHDVNLSAGGVVYVGVASLYTVGAIAATTRIYFEATYFVG